MPAYRVTFVYTDSQNREGRKVFQTVDDLADFAAAEAAAAALYTDLAALMDAEILRYEIAGETVVSDSGGATSNKDTGITIQVRKTDTRRDVLKVPAPVSGLLDGNGNLDPANVLVVGYVGNFQAAGSFTFSDGEQVESIVGGYLDE